MWQSQNLRSWLIVPALFALVLTACGEAVGQGAAPAEELSLRITSPEDGAEIGETFTIELEANVALDDPSTGEHHVHICIDSDDCGESSEYSLVYGNTFELAGLTPGQRTITASLRNADHSDAGVSDEITVVVSGGGTGADDTTETTVGAGTQPDYGYDPGY